jgi:hypothetical protein
VPVWRGHERLGERGAAQVFPQVHYKEAILVSVGEEAEGKRFG